MQIKTGDASWNGQIAKLEGFVVYGHALLTLHSLWSNMADKGRRTLWRRKLTFTMAILTSLTNFTAIDCRILSSDLY